MTADETAPAAPGRKRKADPDPAPESGGDGAGASWTCVRECYWRGRLWKPGDTWRGPEAPEHFERG